MVCLCFRFDGTKTVPNGTDITLLWNTIYKTIRTVSPGTMISSYRGDVCAPGAGATLYTNAGPPPNSTDSSACFGAGEGGQYFHPTEMHGITIQEGRNGNTDEQPTVSMPPPLTHAHTTTTTHTPPPPLPPPPLYRRRRRPHCLRT